MDLFHVDGVVVPQHQLVRRIGRFAVKDRPARRCLPFTAAADGNQTLLRSEFESILGDARQEHLQAPRLVGLFQLMERLYRRLGIADVPALAVGRQAGKCWYKILNK